MEDQSNSDGNMNVSQSSSSSINSLDRIYPSLEPFTHPHDSDDDDDNNSQTSSGGTKSSLPPSPSHKKYLFPKKEYVDHLRPEEINWFYQQEGEKKWTPFIGYDSLRIECRYRALAINSPDVSKDIDVKERILVRGGLYEVDVDSKQCIPVYWSGDISNIMRGTWFYDGTWQPLQEGYATQLETEHLAKFMGQKIVDVPSVPGGKGTKPVIHNIKFHEFHIDWNSANEVFLFSESASSKFMRKVTHSFGWQKSGTRLHRAYCYEAIMDDKPPDITHLVFVIHGIGQKMETGSIVKCCRDLRTKVNHLKYKFFPDFDSTNQRAEFLPVEWRSSLKLDGDTVDNITPNKMKGVRNILNSSAMDILYYTSPLYRSEITHSLQSELNRLYKMFCSRHPYFEANRGKVSIIAHSLGSVITYDIITGWNPLKMYDQFVTSVINEERQQPCGSDELIAELDKARRRVNELEASVREKHKSTPMLNFTIENLFCLGSPLAVFLALRGMRPQGTGTQEHIIPSSVCKRLFNIYHPSDPVAYRLEPLVLKHYATIMPLPIHHYNSPKKVPYVKLTRKAYAALKTMSEEQINNKSLKIEEVSDSYDKGDSDSASEKTTSHSSKKFSFSKWLSGRKSKDEEALSAELKMLQKFDNEAQKLQVEYLDPKDIDKTEMEYRLDYQLKERSLENSYMSLLTSHTSYWSNKDIALFILTHLHPHLQEQNE
ncbi:hypothetical protein SNE40_010986 [Patella caerulea]|uniref:DDHD domain-containing protein n=1 Tax=Patella caerulea TaxID=87958 RepID=A0AAN8JV94_PATCE